MINFNARNKYSKPYPPNSIKDYLAHPSGINESIQISLFNHHRFAFYFWSQWKNDLIKKKNIDLISFDWHQDLVYPDSIEKTELENLEIDNTFEVSCFSSFRLSPLNDTHIMSAVYLDLINDVWILCRQGSSQNSWEDKYFEDYKGKKHKIRKFKTEEELKDALFLSNIQNVFFDIDLDYFTLNNNIEPNEKFRYMKDKEIKNLLSYENELIKWIFERLEGITIALEPEFTGGISKSLKYMSLIEKLWFNKPIGNWNIKWNHLN